MDITNKMGHKKKLKGDEEGSANHKEKKSKRHVEEMEEKLEISREDGEIKRVDKEEKKQKSISFAEDVIDNEDDAPPRKKKKKNKDEIVIKPTETPTEQELLEIKKPENVKSIESKRHKKKIKHEQLIADRKITKDLEMQQKNLNYLSLWKHNRDGWKFNKIQQVWLHKHMLDDKFIPDGNFEVLIEYFSGAKGQIRQTILKECTEIFEKLEGNEIEDETDKVKYQRARNMLQSLSE